MRDATAGISEIERVNETRTGSEGATGWDGWKDGKGRNGLGRQDRCADGRPRGPPGSSVFICCMTLRWPMASKMATSCHAAARDQSYDFHHLTAMQSEIRNT